MPQGGSTAMTANAILIAGEPVTKEYEAKTITTFGPGRLVIADTTSYQCQVAGATSALVLGVADVPSDQKLTDYQTSDTPGGALTKTFTAGDQIRVLSGPIIVKLMAVSGATIAVGTRLLSAAAGMVSNGATAGQCIGISLDAPTLTTNCTWIRVQLTI